MHIRCIYKVSMSSAKMTISYLFCCKLLKIKTIFINHFLTNSFLTERENVSNM